EADAAAEEQVQLLSFSDREQPRVLEKEGTFFRKAQVEAREVDLLSVDFDLREVGVIGGIEVQARGDAELRVEAEIAVDVGVGPRREAAVRRTDDVRQ